MSHLNVKSKIVLSRKNMIETSHASEINEIALGESGVQLTLFYIFNHCYFISRTNKLKICHKIKQLYIHNIMPKYKNNAFHKKFYNKLKKVLFLIDEAGLMSQWGWANVSQNTSSCAYVCGWTGWWTPGLQDRVLLSCTRLENAHKVHKKTLVFLSCIEVQQTFSFPCSLIRHYQMPDCFYFNNCCFWADATGLSCCRNWWCSQCSQRMLLISNTKKNKDNCFG